MASNKNKLDTSDMPAFKIAASDVYDEMIDVNDAEEVRSPTSNTNGINLRDRYSPQPSDLNESRSRANFREETVAGTSSSVQRSASRNQSHNLRAVASRHGSVQSDNSDDDDDDDDDVQAAALEGSYDPSEFDHLPVGGDVKELFQNIRRYTPQNVDLDLKLRPFVPDFIPAVGDIDAFLKVSRPDEKAEEVGLQVLDEPCASQSEPAVLHLQLRAVAKHTNDKTVVVKKIDSAEKNGKSIDRWVKDITNLHSTKPPPSVHYTRSMPDIDSLMQEWPTDLENHLREFGLPTPDLDCDLQQYVDITCGIFDIPTYESRIHALHVLFTLYSAVKNSQYRGQTENIASEVDINILP